MMVYTGCSRVLPSATKRAHATSMTTAAGALPPRLAALSLADPADSDAAAAAGPPSSSSSSSSSSPSPRVGLPPGEDANGRGPPPRKAWNSPPRRDPDHGGVVFMDELRSSWPVPSRDGAPGAARKYPPCAVKEASSSRDPPEIPVAAAPSSSPESTSSGGDPAAGSVANSSIARPRPMQQRDKVETWREKVQRSDPVPLATPPPMVNPNPRASRPSPRPGARQQQARPPVQNGHRGANSQPFSRYGNHGRHRRGVFPHRQPAQVFRGNSSNQMMGGFLYPPPDWGFNPMPNPPWVPNPQFAPPQMTAFAPPESMLSPGYFPGPHFPDAAVPYLAPPIPSILHPPLAQNPWLMTPLAPPAGTALQNPPANLPLPQEQQHPREATQHNGESIDVRLRKQIEYYFSDQNLVRDVYLRRQMDREGWVSAQTIANFPRVQSLTGDVGLILEALQTSTVVEVSVDKMRRRFEWSRWLLQR